MEQRALRELMSGVIPFVAVAEAGSFRRAAESLGLTPAAMSKAIQRLELALGSSLFHRTTRHLSLTDAGERFFLSCREALGKLQEGREDVLRAQEAVHGPLHLSLPYILGRVVTRKLPTFQSMYPQVSLHLHVSDRYSHLLEEGIDIAVRIGELEDSSLLRRHLTETQWVVVASPEYLSRWGTPSTPASLVEHPCLKFRSFRGRAAEWMFRGPDGKAYSVETPCLFEVDHGDLLVEMALVGGGISRVLRYLVVEELRSGALVELLPEYALSGPAIHALCLSSAVEIPRVRAFLDFLQESFRDFAR